MRIQFIETPITSQQLQELADENYGTMIKGVVDVRKNVLALGGELHADGEALLLQKGSAQKDLWGFNVHLDRAKDDRLEFTAFVNIRPSDGNRSLEIEDDQLREAIQGIVDALVE